MTKHRSILVWLLLAGPLSTAAFLGSPQRVAAQEEAAQESAAAADKLKVFLDCASRNCDRDHFRREIEFVTWVREPQDADVHVIMTSERAGGGGFRYTFDLEGREELSEMEDQYTHTSSVTDVEDEVIDALTRNLSLGLVRFATLAGYGEGLEVTAVERPRAGTGVTEQVDPEEDPWDFWVFNVGGDASIDEEDRSERKNFGFRVNANRTTEAWKLNVSARGNFSRSDFNLRDTVISNDQDSWNVSSFAVRSLGEHWGVGAELEANNSTRFNRDLLTAVGTGVEWNLFPYEESTRRVGLIRYVASFERVEYVDSTLFDLLEESLVTHELTLEYEAREAWGNANVSASASQFVWRPDVPDDLALDVEDPGITFGIGGFIRYRILRGLSLNVSGSYRRIEDQIFLPKKELSDEDILLGRIRLPTQSQTSFRVGLSYSFGSIFNNAVNTRFRRGVR